MKNNYFAGLDLGQAKDHTALAIIQKIEAERIEYHCIHLERVPLGVSYPDIVKRMTGLMQESPLLDEGELVVDATGVGRPVVDMFREAGLKFTAVSIHGGDNVNYKDGYAYVPKRDLVGGLQVFLQEGQLQFAKDLKEAPTLINELLNFQVKINDKAHDSYGAWREGTHDDLVLAVALAVWKATRPVIKLADPPRSRNARY